MKTKAIPSKVLQPAEDQETAEEENWTSLIKEEVKVEE